MIESLIFDFDGLIIDTESAEYQSWAEMYEEHGCELPIDLWADQVGRASDSITFDPYSYLELKHGRPVDRDSIRQRRRRRNAELVAALPIRPGVEDYLADARRLGFGLAVASSSPRSWVDGHLTRLGLRSHFAHVTCADEIGRGKPDPAVYLATLERLNVSAEQAIALEDSPNGTPAATRAGIYCVAVPNPLTIRFSLDHADRVLSSLADLPLEFLLAEIERSRPPSERPRLTS